MKMRTMMKMRKKKRIRLKRRRKMKTRSKITSQMRARKMMKRTGQMKRMMKETIAARKMMTMKTMKSPMKMSTLSWNGNMLLKVRQLKSMLRNFKRSIYQSISPKVNFFSPTTWQQTTNIL
jgi:predicted esterase YcpF (UPF0227 family)